MVGWHHWLDGHEFEQALGVGDGQGSLECCSPWGHKESDTTEQLNYVKLSRDPMDCNLPGSPVHEISQARILERVAISFSRESSWPRDQTCVSCIGRWILYPWATREAPHRHSLPVINTLHQDGAFIITDKPILIHYLKFTVHIIFIFFYIVQFYGFFQNQ